jgi:putative ABC transport system ATP-binding protein
MGGMMSTVLEATGLTRHYRVGEVSIEALRGVDFAVQAGEFVAIMGPSGSGKSTLLHLLGGLDAPTGGAVHLNGTRLDTLPDDDLTRLRRTQIGFVFQFYNLLPTLSAAENVALPLLIDGLTDAHTGRIADLLALVGLADRQDHRPGQLSGGQQQRVAIARALVTEPALVLADEPTGNLDSTAGEDILQLLHRARQEHGQTIVMVTHDAHAASFADRVVYLKDGVIVHELGPEDVSDGKRSTQTIRAIMTDLGA